MQMRYGLEEELDSDQLVTGEWAVSTDTRYVRMCFAPGIVLRMATYEAFEQDMREIQTILSTCQDIQVAVERFEELAEQHKNDAKKYSDSSEYFSKLSESHSHGGTDIRPGENIDNSKYWSEQSQISSNASKEYLQKVEQAGNDAVDKINDAVDIAVPNFVVNLSTGHLMYDGGRFVFNVNNIGHLEWGLAV